MKTILVLLCLYIAVANSYRVFAPSARVVSLRAAKLRHWSLRMSEDVPHEDHHTVVPTFVPADKLNIESAAAVTGGVLGLVLGGPKFGLLVAAFTNYASKQENESGEALRGVGKTVLESYNFFHKLNTQYQLTNKVCEAVDTAVSSAASESQTLRNLQEICKATTDKLESINKEYDLTNKGKDIIVAAATLSDATIGKAIELNKKYDLVNNAVKAMTNAVEKLRERFNQ